MMTYYINNWQYAYLDLNLTNKILFAMCKFLHKQEKVDDLQATLERQRKEIKKRRDTESTLQTDIDDLREEMGQSPNNPVCSLGRLGHIFLFQKM